MQWYQTNIVCNISSDQFNWEYNKQKKEIIMKNENKTQQNKIHSMLKQNQRIYLYKIIWAVVITKFSRQHGPTLSVHGVQFFSLLLLFSFVSLFSCAHFSFFFFEFLQLASFTSLGNSYINYVKIHTNMRMHIVCVNVCESVEWYWYCMASLCLIRLCCM